MRTNLGKSSLCDKTKIARPGRGHCGFRIERMLNFINVYLVVSKRQRGRPTRSVNALESQHPFVERTCRFERLYSQHEMVYPTDHCKLVSVAVYLAVASVGAVILVNR